MLSKQKPSFEKSLRWILPYFRKIHPNALTFAGLIPPILFYIFMLQQYFFVSLFILPLSFLDMLDGAVARKFKKVTFFGGFMDSLFDRISDFLYIIAFIFSNLVRLELGLPLILLSFLISYMRARGGNGSNTEMPGFMERTERIIGLFFALFAYVLFPTTQIYGFNSAEIVFLFLLPFTIYTFFQRLYFIYQLSESKYS